MASNNNYSGLKFAGIALVVVGLSGVIGYFVAGVGHTPAVVKPPTVTQSASDTAADAAHTGISNQIARGGDYTAPGAPKIDIREVKPHLTDTSHTPKPTVATPDPEASQEAPPPPPPDVTPPPDDSNSSLASPVTGETSSPGSNDPDYESVGSNADAPPTNDDQPSLSGSGGPYRVQVGPFAFTQSAKALADALRNRGYSTTTIVDKSGDKTKYYVQTGAFRSQKSATKATQDLLKQGYPAFTKSPE